CQQWSSNPYTF
nr:immunoglobulin light chain junction region [Mus musculus]NSL99581.1 immunoglobulin light chain junction region [Mus musculus]NSL99912.1 immunoglobulin light chain junction region [Mus musculus]NSM00254.1 immunoglobulin light chain junction region [Mus musculus]NSM00484.1 immunoglobulin light chain junction region [Mus musculus]